MPERHVVARARDLPEGRRTIVQVKGHSIGIFHQGGRYYALLNRCPHLGAPLCSGDLVPLLESERPGQYVFDPSRAFLACPWHGWEFDLATGQSYFDPARTRVRSYEVGAERLGRLSKGPYVVESFPVEVEDEYLVLTLSPGREAR
jgi:nitrite reductase/ring-hydroxylating ferredoxin subunit